MTDTDTIRNQPPPPRPQFAQQQIRPNPQSIGPQGAPPLNQIRPQQNPLISTNGQPPRPNPPPQLRRVDSKGNLLMNSPNQPPQPRPQGPMMTLNGNRPPMPPNQMQGLGGQPRPQQPLLNAQQQNQQMRPQMPPGSQQQNPQMRPPFPPGGGGPRLPGQHPVTAPNQPPFRPPFQQQQQPQQQQLQQQQQQQREQVRLSANLSKSDSNASMNFDPVKTQMNLNNSKITYQITESEDNGVTMTKVITPGNQFVTLKDYVPTSPEDTPREKPDDEPEIIRVEEPPQPKQPPPLPPQSKAIQQKTYTDLKKNKKGDNDSGVDESTQEKERNGPASPNSPVKSPTKPHSGLSRPPSATPSNKSSKSRSASRSRLLAKTPEPEPVKKVPMNKIKVGYAPSPDLKSVRSKIGSLDNSSYRPGGGQVKIETKKVEIKAAPRIEAKNDKYIPKGGDKKILTTKLQWNAKSKIGSLENANHKPGGGDKKIETLKSDFKDKAKPKVGSKDNVKHVPGGGDIKIQTQKIEIKAQSKIGSMDNVKHKPGGGDKKIFDDKDYLKNVEHPVALTQPSQYYKAPSSMPRSQTITSEMSLPAECIVLSVSTPSINGAIRPKSAGARPIKKKNEPSHPKPFRLY